MTKIIDLPTTASTDANTFVPVYKNGKTQKVSATVFGGGGSGLDLTSTTDVPTVEGTEYIPLNKPLGTVFRVTVQRILDWILARANTWTANQTFNANVNFTGNVLATSGALGYGVGAGGTVVQATSKATDVTLNKPSGYITTSNSALAAGATVVFRFNNSSVSADGSEVLSFTVAGYDADRYAVAVSVFAPGVCSVSIKNNTAVSLSEAVPINFAVIKAARS